MSVSIKDPNCPQWYRNQVAKQEAERRAKGVPLRSAPRKGCVHEKSRGRIAVAGLALVRMAHHRGGPIHTFVQAQAGGKKRRFCIGKLGFAEAFRRALTFRAAYERSLAK